jgi:signal transduction histidine kinase
VTSDDHRASSDAGANGRRILVVDDSREIREAVGETLEEIGYVVVVAGDGQEAVECLQRGPLPDLILLDLRLPVMDGWEFRVLQRRNKLWKHIPVIAISADATAQAEAIDADYFLKKPFTAEVLEQEVGRVLAIVDRERARATRQALADRLASLGTLAAGVGHEINNPLAYVIGNLDFVAEQVRLLDPELPRGRLRDIDQALGEMREGANRIRRIVRDLRVFARTDEEKRVPTDLRPVLELAVNMAFPEIRHRARLIRDLDRTPMVDADDARLAQVFINLLVNAAQAIPEGHVDRNEIRIRTHTNRQGWAVIDIHDTGAGIPEAVRPRIFDPFVTTKMVGAGTGLGLSICHEIVEAHDGEITFESDPTMGTRFRVCLPPSRLQARPDSAQANGVVDVAGRRGRVLVVDDEPMIVASLRRTLSHEHEVAVASGGRQAWDMLVNGERFDVVLCDLMMPEMTGMDLYEHVGELDPCQRDRMLFLTGGAFTPRAQSFLESIPNPRIEKPFDGPTLCALVRSLMS